MKAEKAKQLVAACHDGRMILDQMPVLPEGITPLLMHLLDLIVELQAAGQPVTTAALADGLHTAIPGVTRALGTLERLNVIERGRSMQDHRRVDIHLTELGKTYHAQFITKWYAHMAEVFSDISDAEVETAARVMHQVCVRMKKEKV